MGDEQMGHQTHRLPPCAYVLIRRVSDEQTAGDGAAQKRPSAHAVSAGLAGDPLSEMTDRWQGIVVAGRGDGRTAPARRSRALDSGSGPWRARSRSTRARARYCSHQFTCRSRQAPADRIPAAVVCRGHNMPAPHGLWHAHGAYTARLDAGAATTTRISRAGTTSPGERERRRERAPVRKGTSPVGLAVAFAMAPLTSRKG
ncbi:hypothetical protein PVAP13_5NG025408 [Panicum virgatum]|uniref:Uncharacterized protein n=1 Tax=Panicum virgatum TaxID=38727 RepID=A0A8T0RNC4_PANVG|nr:hypothetical protein PVAP13_5NG025408 [Panicum virgatum]